MWLESIVQSPYVSIISMFVAALSVFTHARWQTHTHFSSEHYVTRIFIRCGWRCISFVTHSLTLSFVRAASRYCQIDGLCCCFFYWSHLGLVSNYLLYHCMLSSARLEARKNTPNTLHDVRKRPALFRPPTVHFYESNNDCGQI